MTEVPNLKHCSLGLGVGSGRDQLNVVDTTSAAAAVPADTLPDIWRAFTPEVWQELAARSENDIELAAILHFSHALDQQIREAHKSSKSFLAEFEQHHVIAAAAFEQCVAAKDRAEKLHSKQVGVLELLKKYPPTPETVNANA